ncbi:MAG: Uncharacterised protein [Methanobacteriota archaeon]|nr:MAG: Uncharacterised protein [Euryarchaeota archaeon]
MSRGLSQSGNYDTFPILTIHDSFHEIGFENFSKVCFLNKGVDGTYFSKEFVEYENLLLLFGPEKGWSKNEINQFKNMGFNEIIISESILRVEFAVNAALSQLELLRNST